MVKETLANMRERAAQSRRDEDRLADIYSKVSERECLYTPSRTCNGGYTGYAERDIKSRRLQTFPLVLGARMDCSRCDYY